MQMTPAMIDAATIQLRSLFETAADIPEHVKESGTKFLESLEKWSEDLKQKAADA